MEPLKTLKFITLLIFFITAGVCFIVAVTTGAALLLESSTFRVFMACSILIPICCYAVFSINRDIYK
jgi:hypothetical protein